MSERDEALAYLGLTAEATLPEIDHVYAQRRAAVGDRLAAGDESARVELAVLEQVYDRLLGRAPQSRQTGATTSVSTRPAETYLRRPAWWESYLSLLVALASLAALVLLVVRMPHIYHRGGFLIPLGLLAIAAVLSIIATMLAEGELQHGTRARMLERRGSDSVWAVPMRRRTARSSSLLSRAVRWLVVFSLIATVLLNFASLSGRWSLRH